MTVVVEDVTPSIAKDWLDRNSDSQRKVRQGIVDRYARDMLNGKWALTHQGIAFDCKGKVIDGQHRLWAIVNSGVTVKMVVVRNSPSDAFDHVDLGYGRTASDVLKAQGDAWIQNEHIAMARYMEFGADSKAIVTNRSPFELRTLVEAHKNAIHFVLQNKERSVRGVTIAPVLAAIGVAYYHEMDRVRLADFVRLLVSGVAQDPARDSIVIKLREWLRDTSGQTGSTARIEAFLKTQRVIKAYMNEENLTKIYTPSETIYNTIKKAMIKD